LTQVSAGRVGRPHGLDGSFYVNGPKQPLAEGTVITVAGADRRVERRAGTDERPIVRLEGISDRDGAAALLGEQLLLDLEEEPLEEGEYIVSDLVGCTIEGLGVVTGVIPGPSCDVLEVGVDGVLVPLVSDAVKRVDIEGRIIEIDRDFLDL
jgi:16S rRNA processing protein RimM